jgi:hypothetical protein
MSVIARSGASAHPYKRARAVLNLPIGMKQNYVYNWLPCVNNRKRKDAYVTKGFCI